MSNAPQNSAIRALKSAGATHPGQKRELNEDAFGIFEDVGLFVLADGMGGRAGGQVASQLAIESIERFYREKLADPQSPWPYPVDKNISMGANLLRVALKVANADIRKAASQDPQHARMGATVAAMAVGQTQLSIATLGDVRVYRMRGGELERLTRDHTVVEELRMARPELSQEDLERIASRSVVTKALGTQKDAGPSVAQHPCEPEDIYLLCCDGLWDEIDDGMIATIMSSGLPLDECAQNLVDAANTAGGNDNITAVVVQID